MSVAIILHCTTDGMRGSKYNEYKNQEQLFRAIEKLADNNK